MISTIQRSHPSPVLHTPVQTSYQFQPCLLDGEYLSIRAVSLSSESFCRRRNWETDWFSTPGLVGGDGRLDQCSCRLTLLETERESQGASQEVLVETRTGGDPTDRTRVSEEEE